MEHFSNGGEPLLAKEISQQLQDGLIDENEALRQARLRLEVIRHIPAEIQRAEEEALVSYRAEFAALREELAREI